MVLHWGVRCEEVKCAGGIDVCVFCVQTCVMWVAMCVCVCVQCAYGQS